MKDTPTPTSLLLVESLKAEGSRRILPGPLTRASRPTLSCWGEGGEGREWPTQGSFQQRFLGQDGQGA